MPIPVVDDNVYDVSGVVWRRWKLEGKSVVCRQ